MLQVFFGWILGVFSISIGIDAQAVEKCRQTLFELADLFEQLAEQFRAPARNPVQDSEMLRNIKKIMNKLVVESSGLVFKSLLLKKLLDDSEELLDRFAKKDTTAVNESWSVGSELLELWGFVAERPFKFRNLEKIQIFLHYPLYRRVVMRVIRRS